MRILVAPDKFKGSLTAAEVGAAISTGLARALPGSEIHIVPMADGGEGTAAIFLDALGGEWVTTSTSDARNRPVEAHYAWMPDKKIAVIDMSAASGLWRLDPDKRDPLQATTRGTGTLILDALAHGAEHIIVGLGGSATNDGGSGLAAALGFRFFDASDQEFDPIPARLPALSRIEAPAFPPTARFTAVADVRNPLLGPDGASAVYGPQKGANSHTIAQLDAALCHLAAIARRDLGSNFAETPGAGAAGGLGYGLLTFCNAEIERGFDAFADLTGLHDHLNHCDLVITAEGLIDAQSLQGKGPGELALLAHAQGKPILALCGAIHQEEQLHSLFDACFSIANRPMTLQESIASAPELLVLAAERVGRMLALSKNL